MESQAMGNNATLLVLGGSGFIGQKISSAALSRGWRVTAISRSGRAPQGCDGIAADLTSAECASEALRDRRFDYVVNCAGYIDHKPFFGSGRSLIDQHLGIVMNVAQSINRDGLQRFVQLGSSDEYGGNLAPQTEDMRESPIAPYSFGKVAATHLLQLLSRTEGFPAVIARIFLAYGPGQDQKRFLPQIISGCLKDAQFPASAGAQLRDFTYADDIAEGILACCEAPGVDGEVINLASGVPITIRAMVEKIQSIVGAGRPDFGAVPYRRGENMELYADVAKAHRLLNWRPKVSLDEGLRQTVEYFRSAIA